MRARRISKEKATPVAHGMASSVTTTLVNSNSSLIKLVHLQRLNLADNDFNFSQIPSRIGSLSRLTRLDLFYSAFFGQIPSNISYLSKLVYLNLSENELKLEKPNLEYLVQNPTNLKVGTAKKAQSYASTTQDW
ncbi:hypothetical protein ACSBR1_012005 [Camellia fascicularis]